MTDVIVVGGGPAGSALSIALGRRGLEVELYDQATFPREKACGEGLLPAGLRVLRSLELERSMPGQPLSGVRYHVAGGSVRSGFDPDGGSGAAHALGLKRLHLDAALWSVAVRTRGVTAMAGAPVEAPLLEHGRVSGVVVGGEARRARLVVAADGSSSKLRRALGLERLASPRRAGIRAHFQRPRDAPALPDIEILLRPGYELYVTPLPNNEVLVAALAHEHAAAGDLRGCFGRWLEREPLLQSWLDGATQTSELRGRAPLVSALGRRQPPGLIFVGDAAASVDPVTAGGLSLALLGAELLAQHAVGLLAGSALARRRFERARGRAVGVHRWLGASVLALAGSPRVADAARRALHFYPSAMRGLVELAGGA
jgi:menaquinone-9 beta-reductase